MKKILTILFIVTLLVGCASSATDGAKAGRTYRFNFTHPDGENSYTDVIQDSKTGCKYLFYGNYNNSISGLTPLLNSNGTPDCTK